MTIYYSHTDKNRQKNHSQQYIAHAQVNIFLKVASILPESDEIDSLIGYC